jgi:hypothetical protein
MSSTWACIVFGDPRVGNELKVNNWMDLENLEPNRHKKRQTARNLLSEIPLTKVEHSWTNGVFFTKVIGSTTMLMVGPRVFASRRTEACWY